MEQFIEKLIGRLEERIFSAELYNDEFDGQTVDNLICLGDVADVTNELAEEHKGSWIPCSEKYPKDNQTVLTIDSEGNMEVLDYDTNWENSFCKYGGTVKVFNIIAWQPLPEPYKAKGE